MDSEGNSCTCGSEEPANAAEECAEAGDAEKNEESPQATDESEDEIVEQEIPKPVE